MTRRLSGVGELAGFDGFFDDKGIEGAADLGTGEVEFGPGDGSLGPGDSGFGLLFKGLA
jgi:hypothetical protein